MLLVCLGLGLVGRAGRPDPSAVVLELMAEGNIPGLSAAVTVGGELVWTDGLGSTYPESGEQRYLATADTAFTFASRGLEDHHRRRGADAARAGAARRGGGRQHHPAVPGGAARDHHRTADE